MNQGEVKENSMDTKRFYRTQREVAAVINELVDAYWSNKIEEELFVEKILRLYSDNESKITKNGAFTTIVAQTCGKRRLEIIQKILSL